MAAALSFQSVAFSATVVLSSPALSLIWPAFSAIWALVSAPACGANRMATVAPTATPSRNVINDVAIGPSSLLSAILELLSNKSVGSLPRQPLEDAWLFTLPQA